MKKKSKVLKKKCDCGKPGKRLHSCPYKSEVYNDKTTRCNCCDSCERECGMDV